ncbi:MAG: putative oxidoreductase [Novosphingobium lindaniclasticum]|jgi:choline dehydrogenase-like flavoprotein|uniref:GMC family oxidoreductase N-terminal domain-containing protein n=1 Tax=Novosphingobium lindaniclasticum TaxID=1329895 RepID=UPI0024093FDB|nr:GMC family oxidoreductase [Novosphingobium lindaniclasticum]MDF2639084.1 putative oxidoreductase [Novosphingobium lindaniclasticum]
MILRDRSGSGEIETEILVIGSGPGGAVSGTLFAQSGRQTTMVEEGDHLALEAAPHFSREEMLLKYRNAGVGVALGRNKLAWVEGRCVGGGSEVNRGLYHRTPGYILDDWRRRFAVHDLDLAAMAPHFAACEEVARVEYAGSAASDMSRRLQQGAQAQGWLAIEAPRLYRYDRDQRGGVKQSMSATFVRRFIEAGGALLPATRIDRLRRMNGRWIAEGSRRGEDGKRRPVTFRARTVVAACGAVQTPALLRRSGLSHNIGNSLRFHPMVKVVAEFDRDVNQPGDFDPVHQVKEFEPRFGMGCSITTPAMLGVALSSRPGHWDLVAERWRRMGIYYVQSGGGEASVRNLPGFEDPIVRVRFSQGDLSVLGEGLHRLCEALFAAGAQRIYPCLAGYPDLHSPGDLVNLPPVLQASDGSVTSVHVFSSCPMGEDTRRSAANSFGKVHGTDGLYINDASLLCGPTSVNPQGTVMAVAHRNAAEALARRFR